MTQGYPSQGQSSIRCEIGAGKPAIRNSEASTGGWDAGSKFIFETFHPDSSDPLQMDPPELVVGRWRLRYYSASIEARGGGKPVRQRMCRKSRRLAELVAGGAVAIIVVVSGGCTGGDAITLAEGQSSLRFVDLLSVAEVSSPLQGVEAIHAIGDLESVKTTRTVEARMVTEGEGGCRAEELAVVCDGDDIKAFWDVPVTLNSYSRIRLTVRTDNAECFEISVQNGKQEEIFLALDGNRQGEWQELSTLVVAAPVSQSGPRVHIQSQPGRSGCDLEVADVRGEELDMSPDAELGFLKGQNTLPGSDPELGIAKKGIMLPTAGNVGALAPFDDNFTIIEALLAPAPTEITYRVAVPEDSRLLFSYGPYRASMSVDAVGFEVRVKRRWRAAETVWSEVVRVDEKSWYWQEATVDLSRYWGMTIDLTFRSFAPNGGRAQAVWGTPTLVLPRHPEDPPNIILIAIDTLRADHLSCYGHPGSVSPNVDALAADGVRFADAFAQSNWTRPSFASIFSGLTVEAHGLVGMLDELAPSVTTLAEILRGAGWLTQGIAYKPALAGRGFEQGFESYFNIPKATHLAQENLNKAIAFINRHGDQRFFLFLHFNDPHLPYTHPVPFFSAESKADIKSFGMRRPVWIYPDLRNCSWCGLPGNRAPRFDRMSRRLYVEEVRYLDDRIGALIEELKWRGLYKDTIIVFVSDHGETLWDHYDQFGHGGKNHHDELIHVPMIIKPHRGWGAAKAGVVDTQVRAFDLMPTVLELAGVDAGGIDLEAESLAPMLRQPLGDGPARLVVSTNEWASAVRLWPWKYIRPLPPHSGPEQLFDLEDDPGENRDVAAHHPEIVRKLRLEAAEHALMHHGGRFVVVIEDEGEHAVRVMWSTDAVLGPAGHIGLPPAGTGGRERLRFIAPDFAFAGPVGTDPLALVAGFQVAEDGSLRVSVDGGPEVIVDQFPIYTAGNLGRIVDRGEPGVFAFTSPARSHRSRSGFTPSETRVDARQLEALRALGYIDD